MRGRLGRWLGGRTADRPTPPPARPSAREAPTGPPRPGPELRARAGRTRLVLHVGLHKTASTYVQGLLSACRADLREQGVLYPTTGIVDKAGIGTREGAGSGQAMFSRPGDQSALVGELLAELDDDVSTVLVSSEEFTRPAPGPTPEELLSRFGDFGKVEVVLVLRRQDEWLLSYYKQAVDQFRNYETRSFADFVRESGPSLVDFHTRFAPWRELVGPEGFHALSYDDLPGGRAICRRILEIAGVDGPLLDDLASYTVPRYESVRAIDTVGLRILNGYRLGDRGIRTEAARQVYELAPPGDVELMPAGLRDEIQAMCRPVNERIEADWFAGPVPGFRFATAGAGPAPTPPSGTEMIQYVDRVIAVCEDARRRVQRRKKAKKAVEGAGAGHG